MPSRDEITIGVVLECTGHIRKFDGVGRRREPNCLTLRYVLRLFRVLTKAAFQVESRLNNSDLKT